LSQHNFPIDFIENLKTAFPQEFEKMLSAIQNEVKTSVRLNPKKTFDVTLLPIEKKIDWADNGYFLKTRPSFTNDPLFHAGAYYPQEASSMFLEFVLKSLYANNKKEGVKALDLCAAPGGKSGILVDFFADESFILSNEVIGSRAGILHQNMSKWGRANTHVSNNDPKAFSKIKAFFDLVVIDAPCSGEGLFRKDPKAIQEWSLENVNLCSLRQRRILADVLPALKEDGFIIYSTCTFNNSENIDNLKYFCDEFDLESVSLKNIPDYIFKKQSIGKDKKTIEGYHFLPHLVEGEGFFIGILKKKNAENISHHPSFKNNKKQHFNKPIKFTLPFDFDNNKYTLEIKNEYVVTYLQSHEEDLFYLKKFLNIIKSGLLLGEIKGKDFIPSQEMALSVDFSEKYPSFEIDFEQAQAYLRKINFNLNQQDAEKGYYLIKYQNHAIGFIKVIPGRFNNLYPKNARILN
jgi:16S rRNA C967 or C1407 C5-methylase (RsmB/RsmF family)/NOL1/NOP2/fmu family ribosome biogenesis protein